MPLANAGKKMDSAIPRGAHLFVDESKSKAYFVAATVVRPESLASARRAVSVLRRAGQRSVHFKSESDSSRNAFLGGAIQAGLSVRLYIARGMPDKVARPLCLERLMDDLIPGRAAKLVLESDASLEQADRRIIARHLRENDTDGSLRYMHCRPHEEPLLWVSDAVAWCHQKGGDWIRRAAPLVDELIQCVP